MLFLLLVIYLHVVDVTQVGTITITTTTTPTTTTTTTTAPKGLPPGGVMHLEQGVDAPLAVDPQAHLVPEALLERPLQGEVAQRTAPPSSAARRPPGADPASHRSGSHQPRAQEGVRTGDDGEVRPGPERSTGRSAGQAQRVVGPSDVGLSPLRAAAVVGGVGGGVVVGGVWGVEGVGDGGGDVVVR